MSANENSPSVTLAAGAGVASAPSGERPLLDLLFGLLAPADACLA